MQANIGDRDQMRHSAASGLDLHYLPTSNKKDARLILEKVTSNRLEKSVKEAQPWFTKGGVYPQHLSSYMCYCRANQE